MRPESGVSLVSGALQSSLARAQKNYKFHGGNSSYNSTENKKIRQEKSANKDLSAYCETIGSKFASYSSNQLLELGNSLKFESGGFLKPIDSGDLEDFVILDPNFEADTIVVGKKKKKKLLQQSDCDKEEKASPNLVQEGNKTPAESVEKKTAIAKLDNPIKKLVNQLKDKTIKKNKRKRLVKKLRRLQQLKQELGGDCKDAKTVTNGIHKETEGKFKDPKKNKLSALANTIATISAKKAAEITQKLTKKGKKMGPDATTDGKNGVMSNGVDANNVMQLPEPKRILYPKEKIVLGWKQKRGAGAGFHNFGNTCYLNSSLQAMFHIPAFVNWLQNDDEHRKSCNGTLPNQTPCIICVMYVTLQDHSKSSCAIRPRVLDKLKVICKHFGYGRQEDAHEFLRYLLEGMERSYLTHVNGLRLDNRTKETNPLGQIFGGYLRTEVTCQQCGFVSTTFQPSSELQLDIRHTTTLEDALQQHFRRERLDSSDYKCEKCRTLSQATKQFSLELPPPVLCLQLKRFTLFGTKISKRIHCNKYLNMSRYLHKSKRNSPSFQDKDLKYRLVALVTHMGQSQSCGHYTAIAECGNGNYYQFDDQYVFQVSAQNALNNDAYVIIYEMVGNSLQTAADMSIALSASNYVANHSSNKPSTSAPLTNGINGTSPSTPKKFVVPFSKTNGTPGPFRNGVISNTDASSPAKVQQNGSTPQRKIISLGLNQKPVPNPMKPAAVISSPNKINILKPGASLTSSSAKVYSPATGIVEAKKPLVPYNDIENDESDKEDQTSKSKPLVTTNGIDKKTEDINKERKMIGPLMMEPPQLMTPPKSPKLGSSSTSASKLASTQKAVSGIKRKLEDLFGPSEPAKTSPTKKPPPSALNATSEWQITNNDKKKNKLSNGYSSDPDTNTGKKELTKSSLFNRAKSMERERVRPVKDKRSSSTPDRHPVAALIPNTPTKQRPIVEKASLTNGTPHEKTNGTAAVNGHQSPPRVKRKRSRSSSSSSSSSDSERKRHKKNAKKKKNKKEKSKKKRSSSNSSSNDSESGEDRRSSSKSSSSSKKKSCLSMKRHKSESSVGADKINCGNERRASSVQNEREKSVDRESSSAERDRILRQARNPSRSPVLAESSVKDKFNPTKITQRASSIVGWNGESLLAKSIDEQRKPKFNSNDDDYDEELDQGRVKKVHKSRSPSRETDGNRFQSYQDKQDEVKKRWGKILDGYSPDFKHPKESSSSGSPSKKWESPSKKSSRDEEDRDRPHSKFGRFDKSYKGGDRNGSSSYSAGYRGFNRSGGGGYRRNNNNNGNRYHNQGKSRRNYR